MVSPVERNLANFSSKAFTEGKTTAGRPEDGGTGDTKHLTSNNNNAQQSQSSSTKQHHRAAVAQMEHTNTDAQQQPNAMNAGTSQQVSIPGLQPNRDSGQLTQDLLNANFASSALGGNHHHPQVNLQMLKSMMEASAAGASSLGGSGVNNQDFLNAAGLAGNPALSLALLGKDAGGLANQLGLSSNLSHNLSHNHNHNLSHSHNRNHSQGPQNDGRISSSAGMQNLGKHPKDSFSPHLSDSSSVHDSSVASRQPKEDVSNFDRLQNARMAHAFKASAAAAEAAIVSQRNSELEQQQQQANAKDSIGGSRLENIQAMNPSLAAFLENSGNGGGNALNNLTQPYMQTLQTLVQQQQQQQQQQQTQQQLLQLQHQQQGNPTNIVSSADVKVAAPITADSNSAVKPQKSRGSNSANDTYRDFSRVGDDGTDLNTTQPPGKDPPFPVKLHRILSNHEYSDVISWLPHGRSWRVLKPKAFEEKVIPLYFRHAKYASFMRQVNGWGFKRMTQGPDHNSYYHELFLRGMQHLCYKMRRPTRARVDTDPDFNPDFYRLSMVAPLPSQDVNNNMGAGLNNAGMNINSLGNSNPNPMPNLQPGIGLTNPGLQSLAGMNAMAGVGGLAGMNNLGAMNPGDNSLSTNLLQQQLSINQNVNTAQQIPGLQNGGNNLLGVGSGNSDIGQLQSLRQRREELVRQLQRMVQSGHPNALSNSSMAAATIPANTNGLMNTNNGSNASNLQNGLGNSNNVGNLLNLSNQAQLQQMMSLGMNGGANFGGQNMMLPNAGNFGGNASTVGLNMNNMSPNLSNLGGGMGGSMNQQFLMQNGMLGAGGVNPNLGLGGLGNANMMTQNLGAMLQANQLMAQNQLMGQANQNPGSSSERNNIFGDNNNNSPSS